MIRAPSNLNLPAGSLLVEDADEEIFLLYTRKLQLAGQSRSPGSEQKEGGKDEETLKTDGLGFASEAGEVVPVVLTVSDPRLDAAEAPNVSGSAALGPRRGGPKRGKGAGGSVGARKQVTVEVDLHQSLAALRHRKGDTGSVLWRLSVHLAKYLLREHHFPDPSRPALLPSLPHSTILELGSGTGFLGIALRSLFQDANGDGRWLFSDQLENLPLVVRNLRANGVLDRGAATGTPAASPSISPPLSPRLKARSVGTASAGSKTKAGEHRSGPKADGRSKRGTEPAERVEVLELDWLAEAAAWDREQLRPPVDCIYNPSLSAPLVKTILRQAQQRAHPAPSAAEASTLVVVASELRDEEPLEEFLRAWLDATRGRWTTVRLAWDGETERDRAGELASGQFAVWVAWPSEGSPEGNCNL
ncbi:Ribosomal protein lysine methyltransferase [Rhodotorula sphaerocarpa]